MENTNERSKTNSVNGALPMSWVGSSLGQKPNDLQVGSDRQQATAFQRSNQTRKQLIRNKWKKKTFKIATWNVRTLYQKGKLNNVIQEMKRMNIKILGLAEMRWNDSGQMKANGYTVIYSGNKKHSNGVGVIIDPEFSKNITGFHAISDRVLLVKLKNLHHSLSLIQAYAPTSDASDAEINCFYEELNDALKKCKHGEMEIIMGDFNAKVGQTAFDKCVGNHGLGQRNERGVTLIEWCQEHNLCIANTCFDKHPRKLWTWKSPNDQTRNQIDYIIVPQKFRTSILDDNAYPSADCDSDHNPVVAKFRLRLQKRKKTERKTKLDWNACRTNESIKFELQQRFTTEMNSNRDENNDETTTTEEDFNRIKESINKAREVIPTMVDQRHKRWMTSEILELMERRRQNKHNATEYKNLNKQVRKACNEAYERYLNQECATVEKIYNLSPREAHQRIKLITGHCKSTSKSGCLKSKTGEILMEEGEILTRWQEYISELYDDPERSTKPFTFTEPLSGPDILKTEIKLAIKQSKVNKATGPDDISTEMLQALEDIGLNTIYELFNKIYDTGDIPSDMIKSIFIALPKKPGANECENHRTISLMSHLIKILLRVIMNRIRNKIHFEIAEEQYGFMPDRGTRNAVFVLKNIAQRTIEMKKDLYLAFLDYRKAFDRVKHIELLEMLNNIDIDDKDLRLIQNLYFEQTAAIKVNDLISDWAPIRKGVRQGCVLSPDLFSLYSEIILRCLEDEAGITIGGTNVNNLRYADDTVLIADSEEKLQNLLHKVNRRSKEFGMELNEGKTETMVITKKKEDEIPACKITVNGTTLKQVKSFKYLGTTINWDAKDDKEFTIRIAQAKASFQQMKSVLCNKNISFPTRYKVLKCYIYPIFEYNSESWTIHKRMTERINAFEMWAFRRMQRIAWTARKTNEEVLRQVNRARTLSKNIKRRQLNFVGHVLRKGKLEHLSLTGKINGKRAPGRQRLTYMKQHTTTNNNNAAELIQKSYDRKIWQTFSKEAVDAWNQA